MTESEREDEEGEQEDNANNRYIVKYYIVPFESFLDYLNNFSRINVCQLFISRQHVGSEFLNYSEFTETMRDTLEITLKSKRRNSIQRGLIARFFQRHNPEEIKRIRISGESIDGSKIKLDTESLLLIKNIDVDLIEATGIVDSNDILTKLASILENG